MTPDVPWKGLSIDGTGAPPPELDRTGAVALVPAGDRAWAAGAAVTLARSLARGGRRVYLCDLDIVAPRLHDMLGVGRRSGASDFAVYGASSGHVTIQLEDRLLFVSAGTPVVDQEAVFASRRWESLFEAAVHSRAVVLLFLPADLRGARALLDRVETLVALGRRDELPELGEAGERLRLGFQPLSAPPPPPPGPSDEEPTDVEELFPDIDLLAPDAPVEAVADAEVEPVVTPAAVDDAGSVEEDGVPPVPAAVGAEDPGSEGGEPDARASGGAEEEVPEAEPEGWPGSESWEMVAPTRSVPEPEDATEAPPEPDPAAESKPDPTPVQTPDPTPQPAVASAPEPEVARKGAPAAGAAGGRASGRGDEWDESEVRERWNGPEDRGGRRGLWLLLLLAVVVVLFAAARWGWIDLPGVTSRRADTGQQEQVAPGAGEPAVGSESVEGVPPADEPPAAAPMAAGGEPEPASSTATPGPAPVSDAAVSAPLQEWSLRIGAYSSQAVARREAAAISARVPDHVIVVAPVEVQGRRWWRVISSLAPDQASAEGLRTELAAAVADAEPDQWLVRRASRAFLLDETGTESEARDRAGEWRGRGIDAYVMAVPRTDGSRTFRVYAGAYEDDGEASVLRGLLDAAGAPSPSLVERRGILPE